ncbi:MAG: hypothetical protein JWN66_2246, partial [Sphingomonas bacterium]|nr:hypothetical protein [Sphingomonas bacterium]
MKRRPSVAILGLVAMLSACSGGGGSSSTGGGGSSVTPTPTSGICSLRSRQ